ncbi:hypothetical protein LGM22_27720 (plasmid) [Klebsiella quasipneumoniae subsp. quasipneumoniae]|nr:hypothetical protein LGM22_27720 [Klebsiella quasipneumoniae subsp. quasipneumoniae]
MFAGKKSAQIREILISESAWEEMTCLFAPSLGENCIKFSFDFKREFEKYYVSSSYRGHISYDVDVQPGRVSVSRKASDAEKYKVKQFIAYAVVILGIYLYIKHLLG